MKKRESKLSIGDKIKKIMDYYGYVGHGSLKRFEDDTKISSQNLNSIFTGKNKNPGMDVANKIIKAFPDINLYWLVCDDPDMLKRDVKPKLANQTIPSAKIEAADPVLQERVTALEKVLQDKDIIIGLQKQLLEKK